MSKWCVKRDASGKAIEAGFVEYSEIPEEDQYDDTQPLIIAEIETNKAEIKEEEKTNDSILQDVLSMTVGSLPQDAMDKVVAYIQDKEK